MMPNQLGAHVFKLFKKNISKNTLRLSLMAWLLVFVCSQIQASSHLHIDHHADEPCAVCIHTQDHPTAVNNAFTVLATSIQYHFFTTLLSSYSQSAPASAYLSRAPPQA